MRFSITLNIYWVQEWNLNLSEAVVYAFLYDMKSWAKSIKINNVEYFFCAKTKIIEETRIVSKNTDTIRKLLLSLQSKGLILVEKVGRKDYVALTQKAEYWCKLPINENGQFDMNSENFLSGDNYIRNKSDLNSEKNLTYNNTIRDNNTNNDNKGVEIVFPFDTESFINVWNLWKQFKKEQFKFTYKGAVSEQAALKKLSELSRMSEDVAIKIIEQSISNGWQGLFELKNAVKQEHSVSDDYKKNVLNDLINGRNQKS